MSFRDEALSQMVRHVMSQDNRIGGLPIMVRVADGNVWLKGRVDTSEQKELALLLAQGVPGIRSVNVDELIVMEGEETE